MHWIEASAENANSQRFASCWRRSHWFGYPEVDKYTELANATTNMDLDSLNLAYTYVRTICTEQS